MYYMNHFDYKRQVKKKKQKEKRKKGRFRIKTSKIKIVVEDGDSIMIKRTNCEAPYR